eukprot:Mycagemm_TRINITY_DN9924_c0_g4::TRINITY_DN9924_c0_g4_i1::g.3426::m.3426 type:complete len:104 gc:universal TRINITY_DN9924_c0_g4_i1:121-432(+)
MGSSMLRTELELSRAEPAENGAAGPTHGGRAAGTTGTVAAYGGAVRSTSSRRPPAPLCCERPGAAAGTAGTTAGAAPRPTAGASVPSRSGSWSEGGVAAPSWA